MLVFVFQCITEADLLYKSVGHPPKLTNPLFSFSYSRFACPAVGQNVEFLSEPCNGWVKKEFEQSSESPVVCWGRSRKSLAYRATKKGCLFRQPSSADPKVRQTVGVAFGCVFLFTLVFPPFLTSGDPVGDAFGDATGLAVAAGLGVAAGGLFGTSAFGSHAPTTATSADRTVARINGLFILFTSFCFGPRTGRPLADTHSRNDNDRLSAIPTAQAAVIAVHHQRCAR
jgi:hypothetical protein